MESTPSSCTAQCLLKGEELGEHLHEGGAGKRFSWRRGKGGDEKQQSNFSDLGKVFQIVWHGGGKKIVDFLEETLET